MRTRLGVPAIVTAALVFQAGASAQTCVWRPWAADWSSVIKGTDLYPPNHLYNPPNWDFSFSQPTVLGMTQDTPNNPPGVGGASALHLFWDSQPPATTSNGVGSGGVYQQITVETGKPLHYSFYWKGKCGNANGTSSWNWFEFLLINGPFTRQAADGSPGANVKRKKGTLVNTQFEWENLTDASPLGPAENPTLTPTTTTATVVLKCGHNSINPGPNGVEAFFDNVVVWQNVDGGGNPINLLTDSDFEDSTWVRPCNDQLMRQVSTDGNYWYAYTDTCPVSVTISGLSPSSITDPAGQAQPTAITISGTNVTALTSARLEYIQNSSGGSQPAKTIPAGSLSPVGSDMVATFDLGCVPAGKYRLIAGPTGCLEITAAQPLTIIKTPPADSCAWTPWAADWSSLSLGPAINPPANNVYNPANWDYAGALAGSNALHWFLGDNGGSGGVYQQVAVQPGVPLQYSLNWMGSGDGAVWFEFQIIDGPFNLGQADLQQETTSNNPAILHKRTQAFGPEHLDDQSPAEDGPHGPRLQTVTPAGSVVTVVLKAGRTGLGAMDSFWDNLVVRQNDGPNLLVNGDFQSIGQQGICGSESMFHDACELNYWMHSSFVPCHVPFADFDNDHDVDQEDFGAFQACYAPGEPVSAACACFDRPQPTDPSGIVDQADYAAFVFCITGPDIPWVATQDCLK